METFMGTIVAFGFNYAPRDWALCWGELVDINQFNALYSLLGTYYGGNGVSTFGLPELRGRSAIGFGQQPGFDSYFLGEMIGYTNINLFHDQLPQHTHTHTYTGGGGGSVSITADLQVAKTHGTKQVPDAGDYIAAPSNAFGTALEGNLYVTQAEANAVGTVSAGGVTAQIFGSVGGFDNDLFAINTTGNNTSVNIQNPITTLNYCIALEGIYPPRS